VVGVQEILPKDQLVLRSLLRLLDGRLGRRLAFSESIDDCDVVFAAPGVSLAAQSRKTVAVRVLPEESNPTPGALQGLSIVAPLRMTNVMEALRACVEAIRQAKAPGAAPPGAFAPLPGRYRLRRWPDAAALRQPGIPRLAALLTSRSFDLAGASAASGLPPAAVDGFLKACLALGYAETDEGAAPVTPPHAAAAALPGPMRSVLGRLRERLKLW